MKNVLLFFLWSIGSAASAENCVPLRTECMKFSPEEHHAAKKMGLALGMPYKEVNKHLLARGWLETGNEGKLTCGNGLDATCSAIYGHGGQAVSLIFSAVNDSLPLVVVRPGID